MSTPHTVTLPAQVPLPACIASRVRCVPFLPPEPVSRYSLDLIPVSYVMRSPVVTLRQRMKARGGREGQEKEREKGRVGGFSVLGF